MLYEGKCGQVVHNLVKIPTKTNQNLWVVAYKSFHNGGRIKNTAHIREQSKGKVCMQFWNNYIDDLYLVFT